MKYVYPAIFRKANDIEDCYCVEFPDVQGAITCGYSLFEAIEMAEDALAGMLVEWEDMKAGRLGYKMSNRIVDPTPIKEIKVKPDEYSTDAFVILIKADTDNYRLLNAEWSLL